ncbi:glutathionylspermidine synthase family protein [Metabacillus iocasae]|uniref:Glutathionylspermidine synthase n=1 Tax=Priestia iocasae TaxID=2291674 RepID=A0ABS2QWL3_9BACI|nr:glutathionylspermidine synthase family protein [Metabacillus iocasae]MBM7703871.1 glutathionylspermidine synthase [Metabacillus iocasae]
MSRQSFYQSIEHFWHDLYETEYALYDLKEETDDVICRIRSAANRVGHLFFKTAHLLRQLNDDTLRSLGFPNESLSFIRFQLFQWESVIARLDFVVTDSDIKLLELNADTPTFIKETFHVNHHVCHHFGFGNPNEGEEQQLAEALKHAIFQAYNTLNRTTYPNVVFSSHGDHEEDKWTAMYLMKLSHVHAKYVPLDKLRVVSESIYEGNELLIEEGLYDSDGERVDVLYRQTYPIEHLMDDKDPYTHEKVGQLLMKWVEEKKLVMLNPPSAFLLQSKAVQALIWGLFEEKHPYFTEEEHSWISTYFLPTYLDAEPFLHKQHSFVKKPSFGREGDTVEIYNGDGVKIGEDKQKTYKASLPIFQQFISLPTHTIQTEQGEKRAHFMYGCFLLNGKASAIGVRAGNQITDNASYFLPIGRKKL